MEKGLSFLDGNDKSCVHSHTCAYPGKITLCLARPWNATTSSQAKNIASRQSICCYCPPLGIERAISSPVTRRCWTNFLFLCTCWIPGSPSTGERREENIVRNYVPRINWLYEREVEWILFLSTLSEWGIGNPNDV